MRTRLLFCSVILGVGLTGLAACGKKPPPKEPTITETVADAGVADAADAEPPPSKSLFERLGGKEGITKIVDAFIANLTHNDVVKKRFVKLSKDRIEKFRNNLIAQISDETSGSKTYAGKSMKDAHKGMKISDADWNATVSALKAALDENKVEENEQNDLISAIAPMKDEIVEVKPRKK